MFARLLDEVFPSMCYGCGLAGVPLCAECLPRNPVRRLLAGDLIVSAVGQYSGPLRRTILAFKRGRRDCAEVLTTLFAERLGVRVRPNTIVVPVPTVATRRRERGFDQTALLARACAERGDHPVLAPLRQRTTGPQRGRSRLERLRARERFLCIAPALVRGTSIILVDDVVTTGSTLRDCAQTLRTCGATVTEALVLAYA